MSSATPTSMYVIALKYATCTAAPAKTPYSRIGRQRSSNGRQRPRSASHAGTESRSDAAPSRTSTAAAGDQPAASNDFPNTPDVPNMAADTSATARPLARPSLGGVMRGR